MKKVLGIFIMLLFACTSRDKNEIPTLSVDLHSSDVSFEDLFSKIEIIPLETSDSCLLVDVEKIVHVDSLLYVFDSRRPALYVFDEKGAFVRQISRWGDGPGDHLLISDFMVDKNQQTIGLLSPNGYMTYVENLSGRMCYLPSLIIMPLLLLARTDGFSGRA